MDATATILPSTVMNERSLLAQMACNAMAIDSRSCCMTLGRVRFRLRQGYGGQAAGPALRTPHWCHAHAEACALYCPVPGRVPLLPAAGRLLEPDLRAVGEAPHRVERSRDDLVVLRHAREHLEEPLTGNTDLDRHEHRATVPKGEYALGLHPRVAGRRLRRCRGWLGRVAAEHLESTQAWWGRLMYQGARPVVEHLADGHRLDRHRHHALAR